MKTLAIIIIALITISDDVAMPPRVDIENTTTITTTI